MNDIENLTDTEQLITVGTSLVFYFLPWIIALFKSKRNTTAIFLLNIFLGWTIIGWFIALIWSATNEKD